MVKNECISLWKDVPDAFCINGIEIDLKELEELERRVAAKKQRQAPSTSSQCDDDKSNEKLEESFEKSLKISKNDEAPLPVVAVPTAQPSLASMFLVLMTIFSILNQIYYKPTAQS